MIPVRLLPAYIIPKCVRIEGRVVTVSMNRVEHFEERENVRMDKFKEVVEQLHGSGKFEYVRFYENREKLIQDLHSEYPRISYDNFDRVVAKDKAYFALMMIEAKRSRYNLYSESDLPTLESLLEKGVQMY